MKTKVIKLNALQKKQLKFLEETKRYFLKHPRALILLGGCKYIILKEHNEYGKNIGCAIGRCIRSVKLRQELDKQGPIDDIVFPMLPENLRKLGKDFLTDIQNFHDIDNHWKKAGPRNLLTGAGERFYESIKRRIVNSKKY